MSKEPIHWDARCIVCRKSVEHGAGLCHLNIEGNMIALCCPLCLETFQKDPQTYLRRRELRKIEESNLPPESPDVFGLP